MNVEYLKDILINQRYILYIPLLTPQQVNVCLCLKICTIHMYVYLYKASRNTNLNLNKQ